ncbi:hypothetical protein M9H77_06262 [Catharanthus roseus]|uniref:Uncharacterized protein n=1 Tax=Catharanthus roseus TaxID=4058 RepID=A0ACC0BRX4_CATRO|nr:hypothetical protein M9H77_06262 [Catharanthus roseus]
MRRCLEPQCLHKSIPRHVHPVVWRPACLMRLYRMGRNTLPKPELSQHPVRHVRLDIVKVRNEPHTSSRDQHPPSSFVSTRDACSRFLYRYASVAVPNANLATELTSFSSGQSLVGTMLPLLSLSSELPRMYCM